MTKYKLHVRYFQRDFYPGQPSTIVIESFDEGLGITVEGTGRTYEEALEDFELSLLLHRKRQPKRESPRRFVIKEVEL